jgi:RimJ/RimL family protein N-acetyltransferase
MTPIEFCNFHGPALERNEARHNLMLGAFSAVASQNPEFERWSFELPGQCAIMFAGKPIILTDLTLENCRALAERVRDVDYPSVVGPEQTSTWFVERATELGAAFGRPIAMRIHELTGSPTFPGAAGSARQVNAGDAGILADWLTAFLHEAAPHETLPTRENLAARAAQGHHTLWIVDDEPVAMGVVVRKTRNGVAIGAVYTPPEHRGKGYAGSVTAAIVERAFSEGETMACLYTNVSNPISNRCYARIGFQPICEASQVLRLKTSLSL